MKLPQNVVSNNPDSLHKISRNEIRFGEKEKQLILQKAKELPRVEWLPKPPTGDQEKYWNFLKLLYLNLRNDLAAFFAGQETAVNDFTAGYKELIDAYRREWVDLYTVFFDSWYVIKKSAKQFSAIELDEKGRNALQKILDAQSPGELLTIAIQLQCKQQFDQCLIYSKNRPNEAYKLIIKDEKIQNLKDANRDFNQPLTKSQVKSIGLHDAKMQTLAKPQRGGYTTVVGLCLAFCEIHVKQTKNESIRISLRRFEQTQKETAVIGSKILQPANGLKGSNWNGGILENLS